MARRSSRPHHPFRSFAFVLFAALTVAGAPALAQAPSNAVAVSVTGTLDVLIEEHFDTHRSRMAYYVRDEARGRVYELRFNQAERRALKTGQQVALRGRASGRTLWVDELSLTGTSTTSGTTPATEATLTERRAVVLMVDMTDASASSQYTLSQLGSDMYTGTRSVDKLYRAASFNQVGFAADSDANGTPDVFGPFAINHSATANCNYYDWAYAAEAAAQAAGIDLSRYQHRVFVLPHWQHLTQCTWAGVANVGCGSFCRAWIAEAQSPMVVVHELGHNLELAHAGTDPENDGTINSAYGDASDPMGSSRNWHIFTPAHADQRGWYSAFPGSVATLTSSGTYDILAAGNDPTSSTAPQALKIRKPDSNDFYYLSFRQATGWDDSLATTYTQGVNIHRYTGTGYNPTSFIKSLADGGTFSDTANGITVTQVAHGNGFVTVNVTLPAGSGCVPANPAVSLSPASQFVRPGASASYTTTVSNADGAACPATTFGLSYNGTPSGSLAPSSVPAGPSQAVSSTLNVAGSVADGTYTVQVQAQDSDGVAPHHPTAPSASATVVVDGTAPTVPGSLTATVGRRSRVDLAWRASADALSGLAGYVVYRNGAVLAQPTGVTFTDSAPVTGTNTYAVAARDKAGNASAQSAQVTVTIGGSTKKR